ncbi:MAG: hypothetical protein ACI395_09140 [Candidatus Cryptobacteroides sp.]
MKEFEDIRTSLPYAESREYVKGLVERCAENAVSTARKRKVSTRKWTFTLGGIAAAAALMVLLAIPMRDISGNGPIDSFLASITDEEAALIVDWQIDEIPEYSF